MNSEEKIWIGVDPGGKKAFGVAILFPDGSTMTICVDHADAAVAWIRKQVSTQPAAVGVDAPLWWSSGISGDRFADQWIRRKYGLSGGNVQASNSLKGAALIQGAMFVYRMREHFPEVPATETHPKAVWAALELASWDHFCKKFSVSSNISGHQLHERDAIISAVSAREGFEGRWSIDLALERLPAELDPATYWLGPVHYFWPE